MTEPIEQTTAPNPQANGHASPLPPVPDLPPVEAPSAGFIVQLFVIPAVVVLVVICVWLLFGKLAGGERDAMEYVRLIRASSGNWRAANRAAFELASLIQNDPKLSTEVVPSPNFVYIALSPGKAGGEALQDPRVRDAIRKSIDYTSVINATVAGNGEKQATGLPNGFEGTDPIKVCVDQKENMLSSADAARVRRLTGEEPSELFGRDNGVRFMVSLAGEIAFDQHWNFYFILEGAPFEQSERALFTSLFSASMADRDYRVYGRAGLTYKF